MSIPFYPGQHLPSQPALTQKDQSEVPEDECFKLKQQKDAAVLALLEAKSQWEQSYPDGSIGVLHSIQKALAALGVVEEKK